ncbi:MAG: DNA gyrase subunit A, partial [Eubacteriales bacterium]|nr:DNA gyrase subunit A [Eubacteriales bacterium]
PHGDTAVYDTMVRMAQDFSTRYLLVDGHGNFGSVDGDGAAAMRYTEARLAGISMEMLRDIEKETVNFYPNFDESLMQPSVLPARFPNLLVNGSSGIAVGMATNIPPHNLREVIDGVIAMMDNPDITVEELMQYIPGPDFPTSGLIMGRSGILHAYKTGRGRIIMRAVTNIEDMGSGRSRIVVSELPYQVNKARLVEKVAELVHEKAVEGISDIRDESDRDGIRVVLELKRDVNANVILNYLYKHTQLQETFGANMLALVDGRPVVLSLPRILAHYIDHQKDVVTRRTRYDLEKARARAHILEGLIRALDVINEIIALIRASKDGASAKLGLMETFDFSEKQAQAILDMRLQRLTGLERERLMEEFNALQVRIAELTAILENEPLLLELIRKELREIAAKYGDDRRTQITADPAEIEVEDLIQEEEMVVTFTNMGYVKRLPSDTYRAQNRGGVGISAMTTKDEDFVERILVTSTHDWLMFFTNRGRVHRLKCYQLPQAGRTARGTALVNLLQLEAGEQITTVIPMPAGMEAEGQYLFMATRSGVVKRTPLCEYSNLRNVGLRTIDLNEGDELIAAHITDDCSEIILGTHAGMSIRFKENDVRSMHRAASGVRGIALSEGDYVVGMVVVDSQSHILSVTEHGYAKRSDFEEYRLQSRGGKGIRIMKLTEKTGALVTLKPAYDNNDIMLITSDGTIIRQGAEGIPVLSRSTQGVRAMRLREGDTVVSVAVVDREEESALEEAASREMDMDLPQDDAPQTDDEI